MELPWPCPSGMEGTADALVLFQLSGDPFNATALWLFKAVAAGQPHAFETCGSDLRMSRSQHL